MMHATLAIVALSVGAPGPKGPFHFDCQVVHGVCVSTSPVGGPQLESVFIETEPGKEADTVKGRRFNVRYLEFGAPYISSDGSRLILEKFKEGDRSYWIVTEGPKGALTGVYDAHVLREHVMEFPEHLIHKLKNKEQKMRGIAIPDEAATSELARVVAKGVELRDTSARVDFARQESDSKNEFVKEYLRWLSKPRKK